MGNLNVLKASVAMAVLLGGCAQMPAPVKNGLTGISNSMASLSQPLPPKKTATTPARAKPVATSLVKPERLAAAKAEVAMQEEALGNIEPAAGPTLSGWTTPKPAVQPKPVQTAHAKSVSVREETVATAAAEPDIASVQHKVTASDSVYKLARQYNTSVNQIVRDNKLKAVSDIKEGQVLTIAQGSKPKGSAWEDMKRTLTDAPAQQAQVASRVAAENLAAIEPAAGERPVKRDDTLNYVTHQVMPKETIYRISLQYNVSVLDIMAANDFAEPQDLKADAKIRVPVKPSLASQLAAKAALAPAAGEPTQVAMLTATPDMMKEVKQEVLETKAVIQQAVKAEAPVAAEKPVTVDEAKLAEQKRGYVDSNAARAKGLVWPVKGQVVRRFGDDGSGVARTGINIAVPKGTPVLASEGGTVLYADDGLKIYGKMVLVRHDNGMVSAYAHNGYLLVKKNERVKKGQVVALSGASGNVESPQLHFELRQHASAIDPMRVLPSL